ncbi:Autotransporter adhesin [Burkholderia sp. b14]|nr:Autotransporter adhesin [Burkholderia sp. b14]
MRILNAASVAVYSAPFARRSNYLRFALSRKLCVLGAIAALLISDDARSTIVGSDTQDTPMDETASYDGRLSQPQGHKKPSRWDVKPADLQDAPMDETALYDERLSQPQGHKKPSRWDVKPADLQDAPMDETALYDERLSQPKGQKKPSRWDVKPADLQDAPMDETASYDERLSQPKGQKKPSRWDVKPAGLQDAPMDETASYDERLSQPKGQKKPSRWDVKPADLQDAPMDETASYDERLSQPKGHKKPSRWDVKPADLQDAPMDETASYDERLSQPKGQKKPSRWDVKPAGLQDAPMDETASYDERLSQPKGQKKPSRWDVKPAGLQDAPMDETASYDERLSQPKGQKKPSRWDVKPADLQDAPMDETASCDERLSQPKGQKKPSRWDVKPAGLQDAPMDETASYDERLSQPKGQKKPSRWDVKPAGLQDAPMDETASYDERLSQPKGQKKPSRWDVKPAGLQDAPMDETASYDERLSQPKGQKKPSRWDVKPADLQDAPMDETASYDERLSQPKGQKKPSRWDVKPADLQDAPMDETASYDERLSQPKGQKKPSRWDVKPAGLQDAPMDETASYDERLSQPKGQKKPSRWDVKPADLQGAPMDETASCDERLSQPKGQKKPSRWDVKPAGLQDAPMDETASYDERLSQPKGQKKPSRWDVKPAGLQDAPMDETASYDERLSQPKGQKKPSRWDVKPADLQDAPMDEIVSYDEGVSQPKVRASRLGMKPSTLGSDTQDKLTPGWELKQRLNVTAGTPTDVGVQREKRRRERSQSVPISLPSESSPRETGRLAKRKRPKNEPLSAMDLQNDNVKPSSPQKDAANQIDGGGLHPSHTGKDHADDSHAPLSSMQGANRVRQRSRSLPVLAPGLEQRRLQADTPLFVPVDTSDDGNPDGAQQVGAHELAWSQSSFTNVPPITISGTDVNVVANKVAVLRDASGNTHTPILGKNSSAFESGSKGQRALAPYEPVEPYIVGRDDDGWQSGPAPSRGMKPSTLGSDTQDKLTPGWELKQRLNVTAGTPTDVGVQREKRRRERSQSVPISLPSESSPRETGRLAKRKRPKNEPLSAMDLQNDNVKPSSPQKDAANQIDGGGLHPSHTGKDHADDSHAPLSSMQGANRVRQRSRSLPVLAPGLEQRRLQADTPLFVPVDTSDDGNPDGAQQVGAHELAWSQSSFTNVPPITISGTDVNVVANKVAVLRDASGNTHTPILGKNSSAFESGSKGQRALAPYEPVEPYIVGRDDDGWQSGPAPSREMGVGQVPAEHPALPRSSTSTMSDAGADPASVSRAAVMVKTDNEKQSQVGENIPEPVVSNSSSVSNSGQADQYPNSEPAKTQTSEASLSPVLTAADKVQGVAPDNRGGSDSAELPQQVQPAGHDASATMSAAHPASHRSSASTMSDAGARVDSKPTQSAGETRTQPLAQTPEASSSLAAQQTVAEKVRDAAPGNRGRSKSAVLLHQQPQVAKRLRSSSEDRRRSDGLDAAGLEGGIWQSGPAPSREMGVEQVLAEHPALPRSSASMMSDAGARVDSKPTQSADESRTQPLVQTPQTNSSLAVQQTAAEKVRDAALGSRGRSKSAVLLHQQPQVAKRLRSSSEDRRRSDGLDAAGLEDGIWQSGPASSREMEVGQVLAEHPALPRSSASTMSDAGARVDSKPTQSADEIRTQLLAQTPEASLSFAAQQTAAEKVRDVAPGNSGGSDGAESLQQTQPAGHDASATTLAHSASRRSSTSTMSDAGASIDSRSADEPRTQLQALEASLSPALTAADKVQGVAPGNRGGSDSAELSQQAQPAGQDAIATTSVHSASRRSSMSTMSDAGASIGSRSTQSADEPRTQPLAQNPEASSSLAAQQTVAEKVRDAAPGNRGRSKSAVLLHQQPQVAKRLRSSSEDRRRSDGLDAAGLEGGIWQSGPAPSREMAVGQVLAERPALPRSSTSTMSDAGADPISVSQAAVMAKTDNEKQSQVGENIPEPVASNSSSVSNSVQADQPPNSEPTKMTSLTWPSPSTAAATSRDAAPEQDVLHGWLREAIAAELPSVMTEQLGISVDETRVSVGTPGQERKITHVARGTEPTDAVNKAQLDEAVARVDRDASAGIAAAMAVAGLPQPTLPGKSLAAFAGATYRGQYGAALGISHVTPNNRWVFKLAANANGRGYLGAVASGGFQW